MNYPVFLHAEKVCWHKVWIRLKFKTYCCIVHVVQTRVGWWLHHCLKGMIQYVCAWEQWMWCSQWDTGDCTLQPSAFQSPPPGVQPASARAARWWWPLGAPTRAEGEGDRLESSPIKGPHCRCVGWPCPGHLEACFSSGLEVWLDVARVQVGDAHQEARPGESPQFTETECLEGIQAKQGNFIYIALFIHRADSKCFT